MTVIDTYYGHSPSSWENLKSRMALRFSMRGCKLDPNNPQYWKAVPTDLVDDLSLLEPSDKASALDWETQRDLIVSTVRMGYGHHRIALGVASYGSKFERESRLLDLLASPRDEAYAIKRLDELYSKMSRVSADLGGWVESLWGNVTTQAGVDSARLAYLMATELSALLDAIPRETPFISAYPINGHLAVQLGFKKVINLIFDNDPQHFLIVPGALNLVQTTSSYERLRLLGVPKDQVAVGGHWVARDLVDNAEHDNQLRVSRADKGSPTRLVVAIGGAGAQKAFVFDYLRGLIPLLRDGKVRVMLNLGDHAHLREPCDELLRELGVNSEKLHGFDALNTFSGKHPLDDFNDSDLQPLTVFSFDKHFEAVRATDRLMRVADVLVTKPSELAFVPVPKLHIRRVGDHEAASARRAAELGDGTLEQREIPDAVRMTELLSSGTEFIGPMAERIIQNTKNGVYSGAEVAVRHATST